ncbi:MAG: TIGR02594 family protein [Hyphomicrobiales bacterium]
MTKTEILKIQKALLAKGFNPGKADGLWGRKTAGAVISFKKSVGLRARSQIGPLTRAALFDGRHEIKSTYEGEAPKDPSWLRLARTYLGLKEYRGNRHNPKILEWWVKLGLPFRTDETPWCAGYVCGVLEEAGIRSTRSAAARSFNWSRWGRVLDGPAVGCVVSMWRGKRKGASGHLGFVVGRDRFNNLMVLGGNQANRVSIRPFKRARVLSYHWPKDHKLPACIGLSQLPVVASDGRVSTNEA